ncbi:hypothetical protein [Nakamurella deserti]|uniref:hypothetical protein n=1 Tax=Nakamurella deserti TaxID=2164074 RepID=UPI0013005732|nr:hypothetical protein [Nakamurella deserti]
MPDIQAGQSPQEPIELQRDTAATADDGTGLTGARTATLVRLIRVAYPHPTFPDGPYERTARAVRDADSADLIPAGLDALDAAAGGDFTALDDDAATAAVTAIADTPFFKLVHSTTIVALYDDHEVWDLLGYEGASFDKGGYLHRGFDDLDWLPDPRIEEYAGEPRTELVPVPTEQGARS